MGTVVEMSFAGKTEPTAVGTIDAELVAAVRAGSREAFARLVDRYKVLVFSLAYSATGRTALSEDIAQETFTQAWRDLAQLRTPARFRSWICQIARHVTCRLDQEENRIVRAGPEAKAPLLADIESVEPSPLDRMIHNQEEASVWRALSKLPETYRLPIVLFYQDGQSVGRVAEALDLTPQNVKNRLLRGRRLLHDRVLVAVESVLGRMSLRREFTAGVIVAIGVGSAGSLARAAGITEARRTFSRTKALLLSTGVAVALLPLAVSVGRSRMSAADHLRRAGSTTAGARSGIGPPLFSSVTQVGQTMNESDVGLALRSLVSPSTGGETILDLDFEDGRAPAILTAGQLVPGPVASGNKFVLAARINRFKYWSLSIGSHRTNGTLFPYSKTLMISFDCWVAARTRLTVQVYSSDAAGRPAAVHAHYLSLLIPGAWTHVEVPFNDFVPTVESGGDDPIEEGNAIAHIAMAIPYDPQQVLQVDNIRVFEPGHP